MTYLCRKLVFTLEFTRMDDELNRDHLCVFSPSLAYGDVRLYIADKSGPIHQAFGD